MLTLGIITTILNSIWENSSLPMLPKAVYEGCFLNGSVEMGKDHQTSFKAKADLAAVILC